MVPHAPGHNDDLQSAHLRPGGPHFDDLTIGDLYSSPGVTLTSGLASSHQSILGDRSPLSLDRTLSRKIIGADAQIAATGLVWDISIGQSTHFTQRAVANLFYRGLAFHRLPVLGESLYTQTEVVGLRENSRKEGRRPTGMAALRVTTVDQQGRTVLDFARCAMLPMSDASVSTGRRDDLGSISDVLDPVVSADVVAGWNLTGHPSGPTLQPGDTFSSAFGDVVTSAPELARLTLNLAAVHHDLRKGGGRRLVYGGHTIGLAAGQLSRTLPHLVAILAWDGCDHLAPVHENDTVYSKIDVESVERLDNGGQLARLRSTVTKAGFDDGEPVDVLDWRLVGLFA